MRVSLSFCSKLQISKNDVGIYAVFLKDERGKDKSTFNLTGDGKGRKWSNIYKGDITTCKHFP